MAESISPIGVKIVADTSDLGPKLRQSEDDVTRFGAKSKDAADKLSSTFQGLQSKVTSVFQGFNGDVASTAISAVGSQVDSLMAKITNVGPWGAFAAAAVASVAAVGVAAHVTAGRIDQINKLSRVLHTDSQQTQTLTEVFRMGGLDEDSARQTILRFSGHLGQATRDPDGPGGSAFLRLGLDPSKLAQSGNYGAMQQTLQALRGMPDEFSRNAASMEIFGKRFSDLADLVEKGAGVFDTAAQRVRLGGVSATVANQQEQNRRDTITTERLENAAGGTVFQSLSRWWNGFSVNREAEWTAVRSQAAQSARLEDPSYGQFVRSILPSWLGGFSARQQELRAIDQSNSIHSLTPPAPAAPSAQIDQIARQFDRVLQGQQFAATTALEGMVTESDRNARLRSPSNSAAAQRLRGALEITPQSVYDREDRIQQASRFGDADALRRAREAHAADTARERQQALYDRMAAQVDSTRTPFESFQRTLRQNQSDRMSLNAEVPGGLAQALQSLRRGDSNAFFALERSIGQGPSSYAMSGADARGVEGARLVADLEVRRQAEGTTQEDRVRLVLEASREIQQQQRDISERIARALENNPGLLAAPQNN